MTDTHRRHLPGLPILIYGLLTCYFCWPLLASGDAAGAGDWDQHLFYYASVFKSVYEYGQPPFWNPWYCGGNVLWQNPQVPILSPVFLLAPFMSLPLAMKINIALHYFVGFIGMHLLLTRLLQVRWLAAAVFCASIFMLAGGHAVHLAAGHSVFLPGFYVPLQLYFVLDALERRSWIRSMPAAALIALAIWNGGFHGVELAVLTLGGVAVVLAVVRLDWRPLAMLALIAIMSALYAAPKLVPVGMFVTNPRFWDTRPPTIHPDAMSIDMVARAYLDPAPVRGFAYAAQRHLFHEYANYIGPFAAILIVAGVLWIIWTWGGSPGRRALGMTLAIGTVLLLLISAGEFSPWAPYSLLHSLPLLSNFRVPSRLGLAFVLLAGAAVGFALAEATRGSAVSPQARRLVALVFALATLHLAFINRAPLRDAFRQPPVDGRLEFLARPPAPAEHVSSDAYTGNAPMLRALLENRAFVDCYEPLQVQRSYVPGAPLLSARDATLSAVRFLPNRIEFAIVPSANVVSVTLNQNVIDGWRSSAGALEGNTVRLSTPGRYAFWFTPPGLWPGVMLFVFGIAISVVWGRRAKRAGRPS